MRLRWTLVDDPGGSPRTREVVVRCPRGTTLGAVLALLPAAGTDADRASGSATRDVRVDVAGGVVGPDAVVGLPPLLDGAVVRLGHGRSPGAAAPPHLLELVVCSGPDAGTLVPLRGGLTTLGRAPGSGVRLRDPRLSREHCTLTVTPDGVLVRDTGSTNGTEADDGQPVLVRLGTRWQAGAGRLQLRAPGQRTPRGVTVQDKGDGTRELRPPPRARAPEVSSRTELPPPPRRGRAGGFPLLAVVLPALAAGGLAWWTGSAVYLALAALGPLLVAGSWWTSRRDARREGVLDRRTHARVCERLRTEARAAAEALAGARAQAMPDAVTVLEACVALTGPLWERHHTDEDAVRVRLGRVSDVGGAAHAVGAHDLAERVTTVDHEGRAAVVRTDEDLLAVDLRAGPLGVVERAAVHTCSRFLVGQLVALLPPTSLVVVPVLGRSAEEAWGWLRLLPHVTGCGTSTGADADAGPTAALEVVSRVVAARTSGGDQRGGAAGRTAEPLVLVVVHDPDGELDGAHLERLSGAHLVGVHVLVVAPGLEALPRLCTTVLVPSSPDGVEGRLTRLIDGASGVAVLDTVGPRWSSRLSRALAPLRVAAPGSAALPPVVTLADLLGLGVDAVRERWERAGESLAVPLGVGPQGPVVVDLATAGPHALVAGTTGAGKSELLRSWLLAMAASHPPEHLALLLVDYKGGATFDDLARLPHCVGLLTDLDGGATTRVLHSLRAEVRRRERVLGAAGARDLAAYRALRGRGQEPVPRLLVVVDEFRVLAEDAPEVLGQFVRLAATGRSLGIHLVLATQRPGGVVSGDIRANAALRIALRVQDPAESRDVVDRPDAAWLPPSAPGRAVVVGAGVDVVLQTAWTGAGASAAAVSVVPAGAGHPGRDPGADHAAQREADPAPGGAAAVVSAVVEAARLSGAAPARPPWLPPLPRRLSGLDEVLPPEAAVAGRPGGAGLVIGVADVPWTQSRRALAWSPLHHGPLLVLGAPRSGRSTTLGTVAHAARTAGIPVVRLAGGAGDEDHVVDILSALVSLPPRRDAGHGPTEDDDPAGHRGTEVLLVVDDVDELLDPGAEPAASDLLLRLVRSGHRSGVGTALAGGRTLASSRVAGGARARLVHRMVDRSDALVAGVPSAAAALPPVPGRCLAVGFDAPASGSGADHATDAEGGDAATGSTAVLEVQVLLAPGPDGGTGDQGTGGAPSWLPPALPTRLAVAALPAPHGLALPLGRTGDGQPWVLDRGVRGLFVVAGPAGSGRSTTLETVRLQALAAGGRVRTSFAGRSVDGSADDTAADVLLLDDVDRSSEADQLALEQWLRSRSGPLEPLLDDRATVVVAGETRWFADGFRGLPALARQEGRGLVLLAGRTDVRDVLGVRGGPVQLERHPGRGLLAERGQVRRVQVAHARLGASARSRVAGPLPSGVTHTGGPTP